MKRALLLLPVMFFFSFFLVAMVEMARFSFFEISPGHVVFVGLAHFKNIFSDPAFLRNLVNTFIYVTIIMVGQTGTALLIALGIRNINKTVRSITMFFLYIPVFASGVIIASVWRWVFAARDGLLNGILGTDVIWLLYRFTAIPAISTVLITSALGFSVIVFTVALTAIEKEILDAARIDGATDRQTARRILLPIIWPMVALIALLTAIGAFLLWELIQMMAPAVVAHNLMYDIYRTAFELGHYGEGSAKTMVLLALIIIFATVKRRIER